MQVDRISATPFQASKNQAGVGLEWDDGEALGTFQGRSPYYPEWKVLKRPSRKTLNSNKEV
jgi:hypothetical protein